MNINQPSYLGTAGRRSSFLTQLATLLAGLTLTGGLAFAQTVTPTPAQPAASPATHKMTKPSVSAASSNEEETVVLSPFVVTAEEDTGYKASSTLAGTRLRSDLKDIAASISVVTKDFMTDVDATDLTSLLVYTVNTDVSGMGGNFSGLSDPRSNGNFNDLLIQNTPATRIRGLTNADLTRDYFLTSGNMDSYNVDRVEVSRGANSILFGLGSPAGIINTNIIKADVLKNKTKVTAAYGEYGSYRGTLDTNQILIPNKLAVRVATVYDNQDYRIQYAYARLRGITATLTYQPFKETTFRITHEHTRSDSTKPQPRPPTDWFSYWWAAGQPVWDPTTGKGRLLGTPQAPWTANSVVNADGSRAGSPGLLLTGNYGGLRSSEPGIFFLDPNSGNMGGLQIGGGVVVDGVKAFAPNDIPNYAGTALMSGGLVGLNSAQTAIQQVYQKNNPYAVLFNKAPQITDPHVFDYFHEMLTGPTSYEWAETVNTELSFEQTFFNRKAGIEVDWMRERVDNGGLSPSDYNVTIDINEKLPNGAPNPNFLRPLMSSSAYKRSYSDDHDAYRATAFYDLDLRKVGPSWLGKILGRHMLQANYMGQEEFIESWGGFPYASNLDYSASEGSTGLFIVPLLSYLGPAVSTSSTGLSGVTFQGLHAVQDPSGQQIMRILYSKNPQTTAISAQAPWKRTAFGLVTDGHEDVRNTGSLSRSDLQVHSFSAVAQSYWFDGDLVSTLGYRKDRVWNFDAGSSFQTNDGSYDNDWHVFYPKLTRAIQDSSDSYGVVGHLPKFLQRYLPWGTELSLFYNHSDNFQVAPLRYNLVGDALPAQTGTTRDYGILISTFHGKLDLRVAHYETVAGDATVNTLGGSVGQLSLVPDSVIEHDYAGDNTGNPAGIAQFENWLTTSPAGKILENAWAASLAPNTLISSGKPADQYGHYEKSTGSNLPGSVTAVSALKATGYEFELTYNPLKNWRISANASRAEAVRTDIAPELYNFMFGSGGLISLIQNPDGTATAAGSLIGSPLTQTTGTLHDFVYGNILNNGMITTFAQEGTRSDELRKWNYNIVTNYTFDDRLLGGRLNGFGIGGAVRWADKPVIGYGGTTIVSNGNKLIVSDANQPIFGSADPIYDLWFSYQHKLTHGINWKIQLNIKNVGVGNELRPLSAYPNGTVATWYIKEPQKWTLTNTFEF